MTDEDRKTLERWARGRNLRAQLAALAAVIRGWVSYCRLAEVTGIFEDLDQWLHCKLRVILWRQWKRRRTRFKELCRRGIEQSEQASQARTVEALGGTPGPVT